MWKPYAKRTNKLQDFNIEYEFLNLSEGGRKSGTPNQGYRCDFMYADDLENGYIIWPEFEDDNGQIILDEKTPVNKIGTARMWIMNDELRRSIHRNKLCIGTNGFLTEGLKKVAKVTVTHIVGLIDNCKE